jgi:hypothetical protein
MHDTNLLMLSGTIALGMVIGWMVRRTFIQQQKLDAKVLGSIISVMVGAGVLGIFKFFSGGINGPLPNEVYGYPIGLLAGVLATAFADFATHVEGEGTVDKGRRMLEAKNAILHQIAGGEYSALSFEDIRNDLGTKWWTDRFLREVIRNYPTELRHERLSDGRSAIALNKK